MKFKYFDPAKEGGSEIVGLLLEFFSGPLSNLINAKEKSVVLQKMEVN